MAYRVHFQISSTPPTHFKIMPHIKRHTNIELLRLVLMFLIVTEHVFGHGGGIINYIIGRSTDMAELSFINCAIYAPCIMSVDCFILISGYFGIKFNIKKLVNFWIQACSTALILISFSLLWMRPNVVLIIKSFMPILSNYWWFLSTYVFLFILSPMINGFIENLSQRQFKTIIIILAIFNCVGGLIWGTFNTNSGYSIVNFIFIYLIGRYIRIYVGNIDNHRHLIGLALLILNLAFISLIYLFQKNGASINIRILAYNNPFVIILAILFFLFFKSLKIKTNIQSISKCALGIYLFHDNEIIRPLLTNWVISGNYIWNIFVTLCVFSASLLAELVRLKLFKYLNIDFLITHKLNI